MLIAYDDTVNFYKKSGFEVGHKVDSLCVWPRALSNHVEIDWESLGKGSELLKVS